MKTTPYLDWITVLEAALSHERQRCEMLERRCRLLEDSRSVTARLLAHGARPALMDPTVAPSSDQPLDPWGERYQQYVEALQNKQPSQGATPDIAGN